MCPKTNNCSACGGIEQTINTPTLVLMDAHTSKWTFSGRMPGCPTVMLFSHIEKRWFFPTDTVTVIPGWSAGLTARHRSLYIFLVIEVRHSALDCTALPNLTPSSGLETSTDELCLFPFPTNVDAESCLEWRKELSAVYELFVSGAFGKRPHDRVSIQHTKLIGPKRKGWE